MSKHTPGPWSLDFRHKETDNKETGSIIEVVYEADKHRRAPSICTIWTCALHTPSDDFDDIGRANANLIIAAPEMLHEMQKLAKALEDTGHDAPQSFFDAMNKATGT